MKQTILILYILSAVLLSGCTSTQTETSLSAGAGGGLGYAIVGNPSIQE